MSDLDLIKLYSQRILALAADVPHASRLDAPDASATRRSPLCGSQLTVDLRVKNGAVTDIGMDVKACALGQASASIFARNAVGADYERIESARSALLDVLERRSENAGEWPDLEVLTPARDHKNRHASILLVWDAALEALRRTRTTDVDMVSRPLTSG